jgi:hypothetical protein
LRSTGEEIGQETGRPRETPAAVPQKKAPAEIGQHIGGVGDYLSTGFEQRRSVMREE